MRGTGIGIIIVSIVLVSSCLCTLRSEPPLLKFWGHLDKNGDGILSLKEFHKYLQEVEDDTIPFDVDKLSRLLHGVFMIDDEVPKEVFFQKFETLGSIFDETDPRQVHLAIGDDSTQMTVMWVTNEPTNTSTVQWGLVSGQYGSSAVGSQTTYNVGIDGWYGWIHKVTMIGLKANTRYYYIVGDEYGGFSQEFHFDTENPSAITYSFGIQGDMGTAIPVGFEVCKQMERDDLKQGFNLMLHVGDLCYAGMGSTDEWEYIWDLYGDQWQPLASHIPYMVGVGNHEHYYNFTAYRNRYAMPRGGNGNSPDGIFWYSFDFGLVHWTMMSTEHDYAQGSQQYLWLEQDLARAHANRANVPWIIVTGHRPIWCSSTFEQDQHWPGCPLQEIVEPLLEKYQIDMYVNGHVHVYERCSLDNTTSNVYTAPKKPLYITQGTGGAYYTNGWVEPQPWWSKARADHYGYGRITVNATALHYQYSRWWDGNVGDEFFIVKQ